MMIIHPNDPGGPELPLSTATGWPIPNRRRPPQRPEVLEASSATHTQAKASRILLSLDATYNCMGHVFGCRRTWIDPEYFGRIVDHDAIEEVPQGSQVRVGDIVAYFLEDQPTDIIHVGRIAEVSAVTGLRVLSKWGGEGEYLHDIDDLPFGMTHLKPHNHKVWTHRKGV